MKRQLMIKKIYKILLPTVVSIIGFFGLLFGVSFLTAKASGFVGKYSGYSGESLITIDLNFFNSGKYCVKKDDSQTIYSCSWTYIMAHPKNDVDKKYVRKDGMFSTIDIRLQMNGYKTQRQFYYFNYTLVSYTNDEFILKKI